MPYKNTVLSRMDDEVIHRLQLSPVRFEVGNELEFPGKVIDRLYFVEEGMASLTVTFDDGAQVEAGMFGYESILGISALMGTLRSLNRVYTQVQGHGFSSPLAAARAEFERHELFEHLALRYVQAQLVQTIQSAGCNAKHHVEQRLARWLLTTSDRVHKHTFPISQEFMADMIGSTRSAVSRAASTLKDEGLIDYSRGVIHILDWHSLERRSCECYSVIKDHLDNFAEFDGKYLR